jgi:hypothetical protein
MLSQRERDEIDNEAVLKAWKSLTGSLPASAEGQISRGEVFYSALDLAEYLIGSKELSGWRVSFTSEGGPYTARLFLNAHRAGGTRKIEATHPSSLTIAMTSAIRNWVEQHRGTGVDRERRRDGDLVR